MKTRLRPVGLILSVLLVTACNSNPATMGQDVGSPDGKHPLVDRIIYVQTGRPVSKPALFEEMVEADYLLLGEIHDNIDHHRIQKEVIDHLSGTGLDVSVSFEMIDRRQGDLIEGRQFPSAGALIEELSRTDSGWAYEKYYGALFESILRARFEILPANIDRQSLMKVMRDDAPMDADVERLLDRVTMSERDLALITEEIAGSHCGYLNEAMVAPMVTAQRVRDAAMALSLAGSAADIRVLIAGTGHTRTDMGVPRYLREIDADARIVSIGIVEVVEEAEDYRQYTALWGTQALPFDHIWFTGRTERTDPCEEMRRHMEEGKDERD